MNKPWFKAKKYSWGWTPANWKGWSSIAIYIAVIVFVAYSIDSNSSSVEQTLGIFLPVALIITILFIGLCFITGEKPGWHSIKKHQ